MCRLYIDSKTTPDVAGLIEISTQIGLKQDNTYTKFVQRLPDELKTDLIMGLSRFLPSAVICCFCSCQHVDINPSRLSVSPPELPPHSTGHPARP